MADDGDAVVKAAGCCVALGVLAFVVGAMWGWLGGGDGEEASPFDYSAERACLGWGEVLRDATEGVATDVEAREAVQAVVEDARRSSLTGLESAAVDVLAGFTRGDPDLVAEAGDRLSAVCVPVLRSLR